MLDIHKKKSHLVNKSHNDHADQSSSSLFTQDELNDMNRKPIGSNILIVTLSIILVICVSTIASASINKKPYLSSGNDISVATPSRPSIIPSSNNTAADKAKHDQEAALEVARNDLAVAKAEAAAAQAEELQLEQAARAEVDYYQSVYAPTNNSSPISKPFSSVYAYSSGSGVLTSTYYYRVSYLSSSGQETDLGSASFGTLAKEQQIYVSSIPTSSDNRVSSRNICRTLGGGSMTGPYYLLKTFYDNVSSSIYDNTPDSSISYHVSKY